MKKYIIISVIIVLISIITLIGTTYALLTMTIEGDKKITLTAGILKVDFEEGDNINLENMAPMTDSKGLKTIPYTFTVTNTGNINAYYHVSLEEDINNTLSNSYLKMKLTSDNGYDSGVVKVSDYGTGTFDITSEETLKPEDKVTYQLWMWLDETADNSAQGKEYKSKIVVTSYDREQKSLALKQILEDNELQEEKENMFNYASNGSYVASVTEEGPQYGNEPSQVTNGLYSMEDEDGTSYYYRGIVDNNNVQFGQYENDYYVYQNGNNYYQSEDSCIEAGNSTCTPVKLTSTGDKMYWKIVRVNGDGSLRLIYNGTSANPTNSDLMNSYAVGVSQYNLEHNDPKYSGYTYDNGTDSFIKKEVDTWYKNALGNTTYDSKVSSGRFCSDSSGYKNASQYDISEVLFEDLTNIYMYSSMGDRLANYQKNSPGNNAPSLKCPETSESYGGSYRLKAGLITADELTLAGESYGVGGNSYLNPRESEMYYWIMTPGAFDNSGTIVWFQFDYLASGSSVGNVAVRPVINVTTDDGFTSGDGTVSSPYVIS